VEFGITQTELVDLHKNFPNLGLENFKKELSEICCSINKKGNFRIYNPKVAFNE
jgi:hypothetical protein